VSITLAVDTARSFQTMIYMGCEPRLNFKTKEHERNRDGVLKWGVTLAVQTRPADGQRSESATVVVTIPGMTDPVAELVPGTPVDVVDMYSGTSTAETRGEGDDLKLRGGRQYFQGSAIVARIPVKS
jgi:hypothetical protein